MQYDNRTGRGIYDVGEFIVKEFSGDTVAYFYPIVLVKQAYGETCGVLQRDGKYLMESGSIEDSISLELRGAIFCNWNTFKKLYKEVCNAEN